MLLSAESIGCEPSRSWLLDFGILPVDVAAEDGKPGRFLLGGLAVETWGLKVTLRVTLGTGRALLELSRSSKGDVSDMVERVCDKGRERSVAGVVGRGEKRDGLARFNFGPCPDEEIESGVFVPVYNIGDCGVICSIPVKRRWCMGGAGGA